MFRTWRTSTGLVGVIALLFGLPFITPWLTSEQRVKLFRLEMIIIAECVLFFVVSRYIWNTVKTFFDLPSREIVKMKHNAGRTIRMLTMSLVFMVLALGHYSLSANFFYRGVDPYFINFFSFVCAGFCIQFFIFHLSLSMFVRFNWWIWKNRVEFFRRLDKVYAYRIIFIITTSITVLMTVYGVHHAAQPPRVINVDIPITGLPRSMNRFSIVVVSDIHLGPTVGGAKLTRIVKIINELNPGKYYLYVFVNLAV